MRALEIVVVGPGRAGGSVVLAAARAGHRIAAVVPGPSGRIPSALESMPVRSVLPPCDLLLLAVPDDAIAPVAASLGNPPARVVAHLSGFTSSDVLAHVRSFDRAVGALHPIQSLPSPELGADALSGSYAAVSGDPPAVELLTAFGESLGMLPFEIDDALRPLHHAAAAAASNFVAAALLVSRGLADRAGVPLEAYAGLTAQTIANVAAKGLEGLTGPIARGDVGTVHGQLAAIARDAPELLSSYVALVRATAALTPHREHIDSVAGEYE